VRQPAEPGSRQPEREHRQCVWQPNSKTIVANFFNNYGTALDGKVSPNMLIGDELLEGATMTVEADSQNRVMVFHFYARSNVWGRLGQSSVIGQLNDSSDLGQYEFGRYLSR